MNRKTFISPNKSIAAVLYLSGQFAESILYFTHYHGSNNHFFAVHHDSKNGKFVFCDCEKNERFRTQSLGGIPVTEAFIPSDDA